MRAEEKVKCQTSSLLLAATEPCGIEQIMKAEDLSDLQRLLRVTVLVVKFVRTMKSSLKKDISSQVSVLLKTSWGTPKLCGSRKFRSR